MTYEWLKPAIIFGSILYAVIGIVVLGVFFVIVDKLTPYHLWTEIVEKKNVALAIVLGALVHRGRPDRGGGGPWVSDPAAEPIAANAAAHPAAIGAAEVALLASVFVVAACGLVYELAAGTLASYLLGDSILQFSTVIGTYLFAMGVGSWLSRYLERQLVAQFLRIELLVGLIGGLMPAALFALQSLATPSFRFALYALVLAVGILVGLEIPLVMRILKRHAGADGSGRGGLKTLVSQVLTFDYLGALAVSIAFPLLLVPQLGLIRTGALFGLMNAGVALWALWLFRGELRGLAAHAAACALTIAALVGALVFADHVTTWAEDRFYADHVIYSETSAYQRVVVTASRAGVRLFLNGNLQFHSRDEYRYHEALVHPALAAAGAPRTRARSRRRRRHGGARGAAPPERRADHAGRARSRT